MHHQLSAPLFSVADPRTSPSPSLDSNSHSLSLDSALCDESTLKVNPTVSRFPVPPPLVAVFDGRGVNATNSRGLRKYEHSDPFSPMLVSPNGVLQRTCQSPILTGCVDNVCPLRSTGGCVDDVQLRTTGCVDNSTECTTRLSLLVNSSKFSDVTLVVGERKYCAHKLMLANVSNVFEQMLTNQSWMDSGQSELSLEEHESCLDVFEDFLRYIYTSQVRLSTTTVLGILVLADKYNVSDLKMACSNFMSSRLVGLPEDSKAITWYQYASACTIHPLEHACLNYMILNLDTVLKSTDWPYLDKNNLITILRRSDVIVESEYVLLLAVVRWLSDECRANQITDNLVDIIPLVRFPMILPEQLYEFEMTPFQCKHNDQFQRYLLTAYRYHALSIKGRRESGASSVDGVPVHQYAYRNYTDDMYAMYVDVVRKSYLSCQQVSSKVERPLSLPVSVSNAMPDRRCKLKTTFYPQGFYTTSLWSGQMNLVKSTDLTRMIISHRGGMELLDAGISVVVYAQRNGVRYADYSINVEHVFELYGQLEIENVVDIDELKMDGSPYLIDGSVWVRVFVRPHSIFGSLETTEGLRN